MLNLIIVLFPVSEVVLANFKRSKKKGAQSVDDGSLRVLRISILIGISLAIAAKSVTSTRFSVDLNTINIVALSLLVGGLSLRWVAILTLGQFFTVDVAIHKNHVVVQKGLYRYVRHPSYTGLLLAFLGLGMFFANSLSILGLMLPIMLGIFNRVVKEERALLIILGPEYSDYCKRTKRFIPGLM